MLTASSMAASFSLFLSGAAGPGGLVERAQFDFEIKADALVRLTEDETGPDEAVFGDLAFSAGAETITDDGLRLGARLGLRLQRDSGRRGFARQAGACPPSVMGCPSTDGLPIAGLVTGFYTAPVLDPRETAFEAETAEIYFKAKRFEARLGRGAGAARLEAEALPGAFRLARADGSLIDPDGFALVRTADGLSGNAAKLTVQTRRFIGLRASASYTPSADLCGVDFCALEPRPGGPEVAEIENVFEGGLSFDRVLRSNGQSWTAAITGSRGEAAGAYRDAFEDPWTAGARLIWGKDDLRIGAAGLVTNDGVKDGQYTALALSASLERGAWLHAIETGWAESELVSAEGLTVQIGSSYLLENGAIIGVGLRHGRAETLAGAPDAPRLERESMSAFLEAGLRF